MRTRPNPPPPPLAIYSGTLAEKIIQKQNQALTLWKDRKSKTIEKLIQEELQIAIASEKNMTATKAAEKINDDIANKIRNISLSDNSHIHDVEKLHAELFEQVENDIVQFRQKLTDLRTEKPEYNFSVKSEVEQVIDTMVEISRVAKQMDDKLDKLKGPITELNNPIIQSINQQKIQKMLEMSVNDANAARATYKQRNNDNEPDSNAELLQGLIDECNDQSKDNTERQNELLKQIHAVVFHEIRERESKLNNENKTTPEPLPAIFLTFLAKLRTEGALPKDNNNQLKEIRLNDTTTDLEEKAIEYMQQEAGYNPLTFLTNAITAENEKHPHDQTKAPNLLELLDTEFKKINNKIATLQENASNTENPTNEARLKLEAHEILRAHGEVGELLSTDKNRELLLSSMNKENYEALRKYLAALEEQQQMLINIAGENKPRFTNIPIPLLSVPENDFTAAIQKKGHVHGNIAFKKFDQKTGGWKATRLENKDGKPVIGLTRADILNSIARAEQKLRIQLDDPNYKIKISEDKDGTIHYHTGNSENREVLHNELIAAFDFNLEINKKKENATEIKQTGAPTAELDKSAGPNESNEKNITVRYSEVNPTFKTAISESEAIVSQLFTPGLATGGEINFDETKKEVMKFLLEQPINNETELKSRIEALPNAFPGLDFEKDKLSSAAEKIVSKYNELTAAAEQKKEEEQTLEDKTTQTLD